MLYMLFNFALRPFRRWWRRVLVAAVMATLLVPLARQYFAEHVLHERQTITIPR
jgi:hypothetical protein